MKNYIFKKDQLIQQKDHGRGKIKGIIGNNQILVLVRFDCGVVILYDKTILLNSCVPLNKF